jgi:hypothetical protein
VPQISPIDAARPSAGTKIDSHKDTKGRSYPGIAYFVIFVASCEHNLLCSREL